MTSHLDVTSLEQAAQTEELELVQPPNEPRWAIALFGLGGLAITGTWVYLLALGAGYLWHLVVPV